MTKKGFKGFKGEIEREIKKLGTLEKEMAEVLSRKRLSFFETRTSGSILHDFYSGIEKIFKKIAVRIDGDIPIGMDWHTELIERMTVDIDGVRPAVINDDLSKTLFEYLRFRHLFRNVYGFKLEWDKCKALGKRLRRTLIEFKNQMKIFLDFLDEIAKD